MQIIPRVLFSTVVIAGLFCSSWDLWSAPLVAEVSGIDLVQGTLVQVNMKKPKLATVLVFLSARCPCSASHHPVLNQIYKEFGSPDFQFVGIHSNANERVEESQQFFKNAKIAFPVIQDTQTLIADKYEAFKTPHVFVVSPSQEVLFQGGVDNSKISEKATQFYLRDALRAIREGKKPAQKEVRVLGCEIKRP